MGDEMKRKLQKDEYAAEKGTWAQREELTRKVS
jgi:hypothetical protein